MSYDLYVYLARSKMPTPEKWRSVMKDEELPGELDTDFDVDEMTGFLPCPVGNELAGFEYYSFETEPEDAAELELPPEFDFTVQFSIGSRPLELIAALSASSALASITGGRLEDPQSGETVEGEDAIAWVKLQLASLEG